ncbi:MAG: bis(5'-nucleosyl)-tetraphosphatase (symmetrical) YqeK [Oscillospiraceae bacterium]|nr:bis(5'-nucleosyl)-tetraphosphatase (symmetrical) YqeK [Oscillospiraceae bacterium]
MGAYATTLTQRIARYLNDNADLPGISSTELRARVHIGLSVEAYVPAIVQDYIDRERLYSPPPTLPRADMVMILKETLSPQQFKHSLSVERKAAELARIHNIPQDKAALAGLLHDCAKYLSLEDMRAEATRLGVETDAGRWDGAELLHSIVGAAMLRERFGVTDPDILSAVRWHNTGRAGMSALDTAVYLADKIEDGRAAYPGLDDVRALAETDLVRAAILSMRGNVGYIAARGLTLHPDTQDALSYLGSIARP